MNKLFAALLALNLAGCATCREHPMACTLTVAGVLAAGAVAGYEASHSDHRAGRPMATVSPPSCASNPAMCQ